MTRSIGLASEIAYRERMMGTFTAAFARRLPEALRTPVAFCGPASFRQPEIDNCWHPYLIRRGCIFFLFDQTVPLLRSFLGGIRRFILGRFGKCIYFSNTSATVLGITPLSLCTITADGVTINYCHPDDAKNMAWVVINEAGREEGGYDSGRPDIIKEYLRVLSHWFAVSITGIGKKDWMVASIITLRWIVGLQWVIQWMVAMNIRRVLIEQKPKKVYCPHEMHPHARIVWNEAARQGITSMTIQHASITRTKLFYFPTQEERRSGLGIPREFVVFSQTCVKLLRPFFPSDTQFHVGRSARFAQWNTGMSVQEKENDARAPLLFVSSMASWDNEVILEAVQQMMNDPKQTRPILLRLHPVAVIPRKWKRWLYRRQKEHVLSISRRSLGEDIQAAAAIVGMNSTVLEEGIAMGLAAFVIDDDRFLSFATSLGIHVHRNELRWEIVEKYIKTGAKDRQQQIELAVDALAIHRSIYRIISPSFLK